MDVPVQVPEPVTSLQAIANTNMFESRTLLLRMGPNHVGIDASHASHLFNCDLVTSWEHEESKWSHQLCIAEH